MAFIEDRWHRKDRTRTERYGKGLRWRVEWEDTQGKKRRKGFEYKDLAEDFLTEIRHERKRGVYRGPQLRLTVSELFEMYVASRDLRPGTKEAMRNRAHSMIRTRIGPMAASSLKRSDVQAFVNDLRDGTPDKKGYSPATIRTLYGELAGVYKWAIMENMLTTTPCVGIQVPKIERTLVIPLGTPEVQALAAAMSTPTLQRAVRFVAATGLRAGELSGLTWDRVDERNSRIIVDRQLGKHDAMFMPPKTKASVRVVTLGPATLALLKEQREDCGEGPERLVFFRPGGLTIHRKYLSQHWRAVREHQPGIGAGWHQLRHYHASQLIAAGLSPVAVAHRLGHKDATETLQTYAHLWQDDDSRMALTGDQIAHPPVTPQVVEQPREHAAEAA